MKTIILTICAAFFLFGCDDGITGPQEKRDWERRQPKVEHAQKNEIKPGLSNAAQVVAKGGEVGGTHDKAQD